MTTNTWDNFDPHYPYGVDFVSIWVEEKIDEPLIFEEWMKIEWIYSPINWWTEDYHQ